MGGRLAKWLYHKMEHMKNKPDKILYNSTVREDLQTLEPVGNTQQRQKEYVLRKLALCSMVFIVGVVLSLALWLKEGLHTEIAENKLYRNAYGSGGKSVKLVAENQENHMELSLELEEKSYTKQELDTMAKELTPLLETAMLGENTSLDHITYDIKLVEEIKGFPFWIEWQVDEEYFDYEGCLQKETLNQPQLVELTAVISCGSYEMQHIVNCMVYSKAIQASETELMERALKEVEQNSRNSEFMTLPSEIKGNAVNWRYPRSYNGLLFLVATPLLVLVLYCGADKDLHKKVEAREEQMRMDYPEIVSSLALLLGAGMTVPNAWNKVVEDYKDKREETGKKRYAYEEMLLAIYEMENGVAQTKAYERFGRRCRISSYNKLAAMLSQNVRKGATNLAVLLREEAADAFEERKHMARKLGEKASTKLLVPMMMLLGMIMVIIMMPAFQTYF